LRWRWRRRASRCPPFHSENLYLQRLFPDFLGEKFIQKIPKGANTEQEFIKENFLKHGSQRK
jgi:hypothetical protein